MNLVTLLAYSATTVAALVALVTAARAGRSGVRWTFAAGMAILAVESLLAGWSAQAQSPVGIVDWQTWRLVAASLIPGVWLLFSLSYARGNAREFLRRWSPAIAGAFILPALLALVPRDFLVLSITRVAGQDHWFLQLSWIGIAVSLHILIGVVLILMNLERTFRASVGTVRWRIKFMLLGLGVLFTVRIFTTSQVMVLGGIDVRLQAVNSAGLLFATLLMARTLFRSGHFERDVYPSHALLTNSLTALLAGVYLLVVGAAAKTIEYFGGDEAFMLKAFFVLAALVALALAVQSDHVRLELRRFVSRHFQRPIYDYRTMWRRFAECTAGTADEAGLSRGLVKLIAEMFQTLSVSIWVPDDSKEQLNLAASTFIPETRAPEFELRQPDTGLVIRALDDHPGPFDFEDLPDDWAELLRRCHPRQFPHGGHRLAVPMFGHGQFLGVITLGDRVGGTPFSEQDFDLLKCVADHVAASMLSLQLARKLVQNREFEAFQTMATFFVHDLKNAASTLNLLLKNLPVHFDDPEFRQDALRGIGKTVTHINSLIERLGRLREGMVIQPAEVDLNEIVAWAAATLGTAGGPVLRQDLGPLPEVRLDREQIGKVITNLLLNAREAIERQADAVGAGDGLPRDAEAGATGPRKDGEVRVTTRQTNGWVVLTVADNGGGMSPEFMRQSLFRPFKTTKKGGLGIGMFQSRMIVEAHGGRIAVESEPGKGTTFQVFLPVVSILPMRMPEPRATTPAPT